jgi:hypothetical protein
MEDSMSELITWFNHTIIKYSWTGFEKEAYAYWYLTTIPIGQHLDIMSHIKDGKWRIAE